MALAVTVWFYSGLAFITFVIVFIIYDHHDH